MSLKEFENRRTLGWKTFIENMNKQYPVKNLTKDEKKSLKELIKKGNIVQKTLNEPCLEGMSFERYVKEINYNISVQDLIINDIIEYRKELQSWRKG